VDGHRRAQRSYLSELLDIANGIARRISAVCSLRYQDFRLEITSSAPDGAIRWPEDTDKEGREWLCPINATVRVAIERILRERPGIGRAFAFLSPIDPLVPISKDADVAAAGGWKSKEALLRFYQQPDEATMLTIVLGGTELREQKA
jgi:integrase